MLHSLPARTRRRLRGRAVLALTANQHYALRGVLPGTRLADVAAQLHVRRGIRIGKNTWYLTAAGPSRGVLKVHRGVIEEIGIADKSVTASRRAARRLLAHLY